MDANLDKLYYIQELIQSALIEDPTNEYLEQSLRLLDDVITGIKLSFLDIDEDDENTVPFEQI